MGSSKINNEIEEFASAFDALPEISEPPSTTLDILRRRTHEKYWHRFLRYFLDPSAPHGLGSALLKEFLSLVEENTDAVGLSESTLEAVRVESEVSSDNGRPDLLIYLEDEWFICIELKVRASESGTQTEEYATSSRLGDISVSGYSEQERHYLYLAKQIHDPPTSEKFACLNWTDVQQIMGEIIADARGQYPARTTAQLVDFRDTVREEIMSEQPYDTQQGEYVELYLQHTDAIDTVRTAFERMIDHQIEGWATRFQEHYRPDRWDETWRCDQGKYGKIFKDVWRRDENGIPVEGWSDGAFRLEFRHRIRDEQSWKEGSVVFRTVIPKNSNDEYRNRCHEVFNNNLDELNNTVEPTKIVIKGEQRTLTEATYSFDPIKGPEGYYTALSEAFDDHVILAPLLTEIYESAFTNLV